ncbi:MAG TPA: pseudouridine synthase [Candidatus Paceibacterota bacterium]|nr:pseudouridine synthase [Candidatus Paceibacterota bacterium]HQB26990.1 pseudouridine synthase [Candidatus Paceibacterota bacterium]
MSYPMRINKYLANRGLTTRRGADELVRQGKVLINDQPAKLGDLVQTSDKVEVKDSLAKKAESLVYFAYYKPRGEETDKLPPAKLPKGSPQSIFPVGRLDKDSRGLLIMTNDGRVTDRLLGPAYKHEKEYEVEVDKVVNGFMLKRLEMGVNIEGYKTKKCQVSKIGPKNFRLTLTEGKKHQIRRMCAAVGLQVKDLKRIRIMNIELAKLKPGQLRPLVETEKTEFLKALSLPF